MLALLQRVTQASVTVDGAVIGAIEAGLVVLLNIEHGDTPERAAKLAERLVKLRLFANGETKHFDRSLTDTGGNVLVVSQFTLSADLDHGLRPSFSDAAPPEEAEPLYRAFVEALRGCGTPVATGAFGAMMQVSLTNDGPATFLLRA